MNERRETVLQVEDLAVSFETERGTFTFLHELSFDLAAGEILCIVGESGSGKSIGQLALMHLLERNGQIESGRVLFKGQDLARFTEREMDQIRGSQIAMVFQDAMGSLNPVLTIESQVTEPMLLHLGMGRREARQRALELFKRVGLSHPERVLRSYPHELSGGMQQRVMIAMALACKPSILIADEPTTALDVTVQAQIMELLRQLREETGMAIILITHDMGLVAEMADQVLVLYAGEPVEKSDVFSLFDEAAHPYTRLLLAAVPQVQGDKAQRLAQIQGSVPEHYEWIKGCRFFNRCPYAQEQCRETQRLAPDAQRRSLVRCRRAQEGSLPEAWREEVQRT